MQAWWRHAQLLGLGSKPAPPVPIPTLQPPIPGYSFPAKQTLTFTVDWRVFTGGTAVFHLEQQGDQLKVTATADTVGAVNMLFPVVDRFQSSMDTKTGCSQGFSKQMQEGRRKISSDLTLRSDRRQADSGGEEPGEGDAEDADDVDSGVRDGLAVCDLLRGFAAAGGGAGFSFPLADAMRTVTVTMKVEAKEEIKTPAGTFQTIRVEPTAEEGVVKNRGNIWIWYTDDARHMPVQIRARLFWGTITFHLQSVETK